MNSRYVFYRAQHLCRDICRTEERLLSSSDFGWIVNTPVKVSFQTFAWHLWNCASPSLQKEFCIVLKYFVKYHVVSIFVRPTSLLIWSEACVSGVLKIKAFCENNKYPYIVYILYPVDTMASSCRKQSVPVGEEWNAAHLGSHEVNHNPSSSGCELMADPQDTVVRSETGPFE